MFTFLEYFADLVVIGWLGQDPKTHLGGALHFFIYDTLKIFLLLTIIIFVVAIIRSSFPPESTKRMLSHKREYVGNVLAALLGIVTPFCSCSAVPLFIGFVESGRAAGRDLLLPDLLADGQRGGADHALGAVRLEDRPDLHRHADCWSPSSPASSSAS